MKKSLIVLGIVASVALPYIVKAASDGYSSYLILPPHVQVEGKARSYKYPNHKVTITVDSTYDSTNLADKVVISLNKKKLIGSTQEARVTVSYHQGETFTTSFGNHGKGKKWYGFGSFENALKNGNEGPGAWYSGFDSNDVVMTSYN